MDEQPVIGVRIVDGRLAISVATSIDKSMSEQTYMDEQRAKLASEMQLPESEIIVQAADGWLNFSLTPIALAILEKRSKHDGR